LRRPHHPRHASPQSPTRGIAPHQARKIPPPPPPPPPLTPRYRVECGRSLPPSAARACPRVLQGRRNCAGCLKRGRPTSARLENVFWGCRGKWKAGRMSCPRNKSILRRDHLPRSVPLFEDVFQVISEYAVLGRWGPGRKLTDATEFQ